MDEVQIVAQLVAKARVAQALADAYDQAQVDRVCAAVAWAITEPARNRALAELAVRDIGLGNIADKIQKNYRKTLGLVRDLPGVKSVSVISENADTGITEIARPAGEVGALSPSTNRARCLGAATTRTASRLRKIIQYRHDRSDRHD